jgi:hypothetical protein
MTINKPQEIQVQNDKLKTEVDTLKSVSSNKDLYAKKAEYQLGMMESLKTLNTYILFFYYFLFVLVHLVFAEQYYRGIPRNEYVDSAVFTGFFLFPLVIYYVEAYVYFAITYVLSFLYGTSYVYSFDKLFMFTDFYAAPSNSSTTGLPSLSVDFT